MKRGHATSFEEPIRDNLQEDILDEETQPMGGPVDETPVDGTQALVADPKHVTLASHSEPKQPKLDGAPAMKIWSSNVLKPFLGVGEEQPLVPKQESQIQDSNTKEQQQSTGTSVVRLRWPAPGWREPNDENPIATIGANKKQPLAPEDAEVEAPHPILPEAVETKPKPDWEFEVQAPSPVTTGKVATEGSLTMSAWYCLVFGLSSQVWAKYEVNFLFALKGTIGLCIHHNFYNASSMEITTINTY